MTSGHRNWQEVAQKKWFEADCRGCFSVATGGGKTWFALSCVAALKKLNEDVRCLVIVPTTVLLDQWVDEIAKTFQINEDQVKILTSKDLQPTSPFNVAVINTARAFKGALENPDNLCLVVDEVHRAGGDENSKAIPSGIQYTIGLSATPEREYDNYFQERIVANLGPVLHEYSLQEAIRDGVLAGLSLENLRIPFLDHELDAYNTISKRIAQAYARGATEDNLNTLLRRRAKISNEAAYRIPAVVSLMDARRGKRAIIFFESIQQAETCREILVSRGHSVSIYHSGLSSQMRRSNLKLFRKGAFDVIITCRALDEGFNVPEAEVAIIASATASKRQRIQRIGRVLRSMPGKEVGEVITVYASDAEQKRLKIESEELNLTSRVKWLEMAR